MMKKANKDSSKKSLLNWILLGVAAVLLGVGGYFGYKYHQDYQANKVYSVDETVSLSGFKVDITKAEFRPVDLPLDKESVEKFGEADIKEKCETFSKENTWISIGDRWYQHGPSEFNLCVRRNYSRDIINKYTEENEQLVIDYTITASSNISTSNVKIEVLPDSGRNLADGTDPFKGNQFFRGAQVIAKESSILGAPGPVVYPEWENSLYESYVANDIGGGINKGLERTGYIYADIRKSENSVDIKITHKGETRLVRISR